MNDMEKYQAKALPPSLALKEITGGRLKGMTDINPQWRYEAMTELYGLCGFGWRYEIVRLWNEFGSDGIVFSFAEIKVYIKVDEKWSEAIPGIGGSQMIQKERDSLYNNDEAYKMAVTDALSVALKMVGIGATIYMGSKHGTKYSYSVSAPVPVPVPAPVQKESDMDNRVRLSISMEGLQNIWKDYKDVLVGEERDKLITAINKRKSQLMGNNE